MKERIIASSAQPGETPRFGYVSKCCKTCKTIDARGTQNLTFN